MPRRRPRGRGDPGRRLPPAASETVVPATSRVVTYESAEAGYRAGRYREARDEFEEYVTIKPDNPFGHYMLGLSAWKHGDLTRAERALDRALELDAGQVKFWINAGRVLLDLDRAGEALERAEQALLLDQHSADALRVKARAEAKLGDREAARATYRRALVADERDVWAMNNLGVLEIEVGNAEAALGPLARAVQLRSTAPVFQNNFGMALERSGHFGAAVRAYAAAVAADSGYVKAVRNLERLRPVVGDLALDEDLSIAELAEDFRLRVRMWQDSVPRPVPEG